MPQEQKTRSDENEVGGERDLGKLRKKKRGDMLARGGGEYVLPVDFKACIKWRADGAQNGENPSSQGDGGGDSGRY